MGFLFLVYASYATDFFLQPPNHQSAQLMSKNCFPVLHHNNITVQSINNHTLNYEENMSAFSHYQRQYVFFCDSHFSRSKVLTGSFSVPFNDHKESAY